MKKRRKNNNRISGMIGQSDGVYSTVEYPEPDGKSTRHRPRRNNPWGNLIEEDTYQENYSYQLGYDYSCRKRSIPTHSERLNPSSFTAKLALKSA